MVAYILNSIFDFKKKLKKKKEEASKYNNLSSKLGSNQAFKNVHQPIKKKKKNVHQTLHRTVDKTTSINQS